MNQRRWHFSAVVCNGAVYALGGDQTDTIERINIHDLLKEPNTSEPEKPTQSWSDLSCQFASLKNFKGSTAVVKDRYIVVMMYQDQHGMIQVLDTGDPDNHTLTTFGAPSRTHVPRTRFTTAAVESKVYIIGGERMSDNEAINLVECIEFEWNDIIANDHNEPETGGESSNHALRPQILSWNVETDLSFLLHARYFYSSVVLGSKIVVAGGLDRNGESIRSIEVIDVMRREKSALPEMMGSFSARDFLFALPESDRLLAVDAYNGTIQSLQFESGMGNLESRQRTIPMVRPPAEKTSCLRRFVSKNVFLISHIASFCHWKT